MLQDVPPCVSVLVAIQQPKPNKPQRRSLPVSQLQGRMSSDSLCFLTQLSCQNHNFVFCFCFFCVFCFFFVVVVVVVFFPLLWNLPQATLRASLLLYLACYVPFFHLLFHSCTFVSIFSIFQHFRQVSIGIVCIFFLCITLSCIHGSN